MKTPLKYFGVIKNPFFCNLLFVNVGHKFHEIEDVLLDNCPGFVNKLASQKVLKNCLEQSGAYYANDDLQLIHLREFNNSIYDTIILTHEVLHYKQDEWEIRGIGTEEKEFESYFVQGVSTIILEELQEKYFAWIKSKKQKKGVKDVE